MPPPPSVSPLSGVNPYSEELMPVTYHGPRFKDSLEMHRAFANKLQEENPSSKPNNGSGALAMGSYKFKFPPNMNVIDAMQAGQSKKH
jgi:hypothetical protein